MPCRVNSLSLSLSSLTLTHSFSPLLSLPLFPSKQRVARHESADADFDDASDDDGDDDEPGATQCDHSGGVVVGVVVAVVVRI